MHYITFKYQNLIVEGKGYTFMQYGDLQCIKHWAGRG